MVYTMEEIQRCITPIAQKYRLQAVYLFGSYARNEATEKSDVDILVDTTNSDVKGMFDMGSMYNDFSESIGRKIDIVTMNTLNQERTKRRSPWFIEAVNKEMVKIYG